MKWSKIDQEIHKNDYYGYLKIAIFFQRLEDLLFCVFAFLCFVVFVASLPDLMFGYPNFSFPTLPPF